MSEKNLIEILEDSDDELTQEMLARLLSKLGTSSEDENAEDYGDDYINRLKSIYENFNEEIEFKPGQLVVWKDGLKNRKLPHKNQPAIVIKVLNSPLYVDKDSGTPYFQEPLDLALAVVEGKRGEFLIFYYDKRRFRLYT